MALFPECREAHRVYRYTEASGFSDATLTYIGEIQGRLEPIGASEAFLNEQNNQQISHYDFVDFAYDGVVQAQDYILDPRDKQYHVVGQPEVWRNLIPQLVLKLEIPQTEIDISGL